MPKNSNQDFTKQTKQQENEKNPPSFFTILLYVVDCISSKIQKNKKYSRLQ